MKNLRIRTQLALGFGLMLLLILVSSLMIWMETAQSESRANVARHSTTGAVAADDPTASAIGAAVLADGGNAMDAAVARVRSTRVSRCKLTVVYATFRAGLGTTAGTVRRSTSI